ncbi:DUF4395 domain-containing protein [Ammoniphilus sp. YIM 78166]|uniref:DUF4395 domain-containing protein n=1 Tax=Ammoniphilus sp. YIM 78166 TaxID=1644106 RepID=UPI00106F750C|nr:DUF4395 domain-containing protein [Ammoniphilus sp. YIM 78166]
MKEIPIPYVRANQWGIVIFILAGILLQQYTLIVALFIIQIIGFLGGIQWNLFVQVAKPFLKDRLQHAETEAQELQRFNNSIAIILLAASTLAYSVGLTTLSVVLAGMVALAAFVAICGYCIGCTLYFQYKQWKLRKR